MRRRGGPCSQWSLSASKTDEHHTYGESSASNDDEDTGRRIGIQDHGE